MEISMEISPSAPPSRSVRKPVSSPPAHDCRSRNQRRCATLCCCWGGWELAVRYDALDLEDGTVNGGEQGTLVIGVNWHLNPNTRVMFNYFYVEVDGGNYQGRNINNNVDFSGFGIRLQVDW